MKWIKIRQRILVSGLVLSILLLFNNCGPGFKVNPLIGSNELGSQDGFASVQYTIPNSNIQIQKGDNLVLSFVATTAAEIQSQSWQKEMGSSFQDIAGTTNILSIQNIQTSATGTYRAKVVIYNGKKTRTQISYSSTISITVLETTSSPTPTPVPTATPAPTATPTPPVPTPSPTPLPPTQSPTAAPTAIPSPTPSNPAGIPGVRPAPAWIQTLPVGQWASISLNKIVDVDSAVAFGYQPNGAPWSSVEGISGIIDDWNGGALASNYGQAGALLVFGGGHGGYGGSDVYGFDLHERKWKRLSNPSTSLQTNSATPGTFHDGSPIPAHTYDLAEYQPTTNSFVLLTAYVSIPNPLTINVAHHLNLNHLTAANYNSSMWKRSKINTTAETYGGGSLESGMSGYDRNRDAFWIWEAPHSWSGSGFYNRFSKYNPNITNSDGTVGQYTNYPGDGSGYGGDNGADCDPKKDIFVFTQFNNGDYREVQYRDLRNPAALAKDLSVTNAGPAVRARQGWEYSDSRDAFIYWNGGPDVWELKIADSSTRNYSSATWRKISLGGLAPESNMNGDYSRFRIAKFNLNGNLVEVAVMVGSVGETSNKGFVYAFRIP